MLKEVPTPQQLPQENFPAFLHKIRPDLSIEEISSLLIDESAYYSDNKDVLKAGAKAAVHYFKFGIKEKGRTYRYPRLGFSKSLSSRKVVGGMDIYYTTAPDDNASWLYRCVYPFKSSKGSAFLSGSATFISILVGVFSAKRLIMLRPSYNARTIYLIQLCKRLGVHVQFDYDDLLLPEFARQRGACRSGLRSHKEDFNESQKQSSIVAYADSITCSTENLAIELRKLCDNVTVIPNRLPRSMFKDVLDVLSKNSGIEQLNKKFKILYLSGSNTHKRDFSSISGPLLRIAQDYPDRFSITFMGSLSDYSGVFQNLGVESSVIPPRTFNDMLDVISDHDVVLVPLEFSVFNHCKSNIKYIESASQGVPVIASSVSEFSSAISHGENGWLCDTDNDWYKILEALIKNPSMAISCGQKAHSQAMSVYSV